MPTKRSPKRKKRKKQLKSPGITGWAIIFLTVFIVVFVVSMFLPRTEVCVSDTIPEIIRLQLLNGCGAKGAAEQMAKAFMESSKEVFFDVIDKDNAEVYNFEKTLVLDRMGDPVKAGSFSQAAVYVADLLKRKQDQLIIQKLSDNLLDIDVTVIIGTDYPSVLKRLLSEVD